MKYIKKYKIDLNIIIPIIIMAIISIITIQSSTYILPSYYANLTIKQIIWYLFGFLLSFFVMYIGNDTIYRNIKILYIIGNIALLGLLLFATPINDAKCWYSIPGIGTIQPSEFMKIIIIIMLGSMINKFHRQYRNPTCKREFIFLFKVGLMVLIPSILTFLQPDTGVVLIYILITIIMLFIAGIRYRWFFILFAIITLILGITLGIYFLNNDLFIKIFGTSFFLRIDRLLDWSNKDGYQLNNGLMAIGGAGLIGFGLFKTPIYFPEAQTDFIFAVFASNFGFLGSLFLIALLTYFDLSLIKLALKCKNNIDKYIISGIIGMLIYQQFQNIGMTYGVIPITGITLPFISYGGSSLLSYMLIAGVIFNISNQNIYYKNK